MTKWIMMTNDNFEPVLDCYLIKLDCYFYNNSDENVNKAPIIEHCDKGCQHSYEWKTQKPTPDL